MSQVAEASLSALAAVKNHRVPPPAKTAQASATDAIRAQTRWGFRPYPSQHEASAGSLRLFTHKYLVLKSSLSLNSFRCYSLLAELVPTTKAN